MVFQNNYSVEAATFKSSLLLRKCFKRLVHVLSLTDTQTNKESPSSAHRYRLLRLHYHYPIFPLFQPNLRRRHWAPAPKLWRSHFSIPHMPIPNSAPICRSFLHWRHPIPLIVFSISEKRALELRIDQSGFDTMTDGNKWKKIILLVSNIYVCSGGNRNNCLDCCSNGGVFMSRRSGK